jgi:hypothetical protein
MDKPFFVFKPRFLLKGRKRSGLTRKKREFGIGESSS